MTSYDAFGRSYTLKVPTNSTNSMEHGTERSAIAHVSASEELEFPPRRQDTRRVLLTFIVVCSPYSPFRIHSTLGEEARGVPPSARSTHARMQQGRTRMMMLHNKKRVRCASVQISSGKWNPVISQK